jgi:hypothetical protein
VKNERILKAAIKARMSKETPKMEKMEKGMETDAMSKIASMLFGSQIQTHIFHLQTKSFSEHMALGTYYEEIEELVDGLVESFQGCYGVIPAYSIPAVDSYSSKAQLIKYFMGLHEELESAREAIDDSYLQNQIDTIIQLIASTKYKIEFLG